MFSKSASSVGRALDTLQTSCGKGSEGVVVTAVSEIFTAKVENPVQYFIPFATLNQDTDKLREIPSNQWQWPVQKIQPEDYFDEKNEVTTYHDPKTGKDMTIAVPQQLASFIALFQVLDRNSKPMNGEATNVQIQWIEIPESVSLLEVVQAVGHGGQQLSDCPSGGSVLSGIAAASLECVTGGKMDCDAPDVTKFMVGGVC